MFEVNLIWAREKGQPEAPWLVDAWDEFSIEENSSGYEEALDKAYATNDEVRVVVVRLEHEKVIAAFAPSKVESEIVE